MKKYISYFAIMLVAMMFILTSCEKLNYDETNTTYEEPEIPTVLLPGDSFLGFSLKRPIGGGFSVFGGSTNLATISVEEVDGIPTYTIYSYVEDGQLVETTIVFQSDETTAGDYVVKELAFRTPDYDYSWDTSKIEGLLTITDFSGDPNYVDGSLFAVIDDDSGDEFEYAFNFAFVPFL